MLFLCVSGNGFPSFGYYANRLHAEASVIIALLALICFSHSICASIYRYLLILFPSSLSTPLHQLMLSPHSSSFHHHIFIFFYSTLYTTCLVVVAVVHQFYWRTNSLPIVVNGAFLVIPWNEPLQPCTYLTICRICSVEPVFLLCLILWSVMVYT